MGPKVMIESLEQRILRLQSMAKDSLAQLFHGIFEEKNDDIIVDICNNLVYVLDIFADHNQDAVSLNQDVGLSFLRETVPTLTEVFLRRKNAREHEGNVAQVILAVSRLLAQSFAQDIVELCELRNILFMGTLPQNLRFFNSKDLRLPNTYYQGGVVSMGPGFFNAFGRPNIAIAAKDVINFWPDEWDKIFGGNKAIGHYIQVYLEKEKLWREGKVTNYRVDDDKHTILLDPLSPCEDYDVESSASKTAEDRTEIRVKISSTKHSWSDSSNRHRLNINQPIKSNIKRQLTITEADVGCFVRVWWSKYQRSFYGRVIGYNVQSRQHAVIYEDGDVREYDMQTKAYEVIDISIDPDLVRTIDAVGDGHAAAAKLVAKWYQSRRDSTAVDSINDSFKSIDSNSSVNSYSGFTVASAPSISAASTASGLVAEPLFVTRPLASQGFGLSYHHINVINTFFSEGGSDSIFHLMSDTARLPPSSKILLLDLQFVYQMRQLLTTSSFRDLVWEIKEGASFALSRYEDAQFKDLTINELVDIFTILRDLIGLTTSSDKGSITEQQLDELRMAIALKLLRCSQIQKRYLGLSMIKDIIDNVAPKISVFTAKRVQYLISTKNGRYARDPTPNTTKLAGNIQPSPNAHQSFPQTTLSSAELATWLIDNHVIEEIFGSSIHQDLASKSDLILVFLSHRKALNENHTEVIWQSCRGAHEAVVKVVHQLIMLIVPVLEPTLRMKFFTQISSVSVKEYNEALLNLVKAYTVQSLLKMKDENQTDGSKSTLSSADMNIPSPASSSSTLSSARPTLDPSSSSSSIDGSGSVFSLTSRKGLVISAPPRQWMGFGVLWQFIQDPIISSFDNQKSTSIVEDSLFDLAIQLLVELLQSEFMDEREKVMQRCLEHIRVGISVPASLQLLRRTLATYATSVKSWFAVGRTANSKIPTISSQIEKFQKQEKLLEVLFMDIERYHKNMIDQMMKSPSSSNLIDATQLNTAMNAGRLSPKPPSASLSRLNSNTSSNNGRSKSHASETNSVNDTRVMMNGKISRTSHIKGVSERLDFLKFILSRSSLSLNDSQMMMLWKAFGEGAVTVETFEKLIDWLDSLIARESKSYSILLQSLAQDCDPINPNRPSKLSFLWHDPLLSSNRNLGFGSSSNFTSSEMNEVSTDEVSVSAFEENVLVRLFEQHMSKWLSQRDKLEYISRTSVATLCIKLFLLVNLSNRALRVESDGVWFRMGPLSGLTVIWRLALDSSDPKVSDAAITLIVELHHRTPPKFRGANQIRSYLMRLCFIQLSTAVQSLRLEDINTHTETNTQMDTMPPLTHTASEKGPMIGSKSSRRRSKTAGEDSAKDRNSRVVIDAEGYPVTFNISSNSPQTPNRFADTPAIAIAPGNDDWYDDGDSLVDSKVIATRITRLISLMRLFIQRFQKIPTQIYTIKVLAGREEAIAVTVTMLSSDTIGALRQKVAGHFKEPPNTITLVKSTRSASSIGRNAVAPTASAGIGAIWSNSIAERLEKDDMTLKQAKFQSTDAVVAKKKDATTNSLGAGNGSAGAFSTSSSLNPSESAILPDFIQPNELITNILDVMKPVSWLSSSNSMSASSSYTIPTSTNQTRLEVEQLYTEPFFPLSRRPDSNLWSSETSSFAGNSLVSDGSGNQQEGSDSVEYLGQYLKKSPQHIDQLLEMLDGYLTAEILKAVPLSMTDSNTADLSTVIWEVVQSLPVHTELLHQVKDLVNDASGASIRRLLDLSSPYRFLYTLQIVDSLLDAGKSMAIQTMSSKASDSSISYTTNSASSSSSSSTVSKQLAKIAIDWSLKFLFLSGAEHMILLLNQILSSNLEKINHQASSDNDCDIEIFTTSSAESTSNIEATVLTITILIRILHRLLLLDPLYDKWHYHQKLNSAILLDGIFGGNHQRVPPGIVLACIDSKTLTHRLLDYVYAVRNSSQLHPATIQSLSEHTLTLVFGLGVSVDEGFLALSCYQLGFSNWIKALTLESSYANIRLGTCRRIFEGCANICSIANDINTIETEKAQRYSMMSYIMDCVLACISYGRGNTTISYHAEQLYSLTAVLVSLQYIPSIIFPAEVATRRKVSSETATKLISSQSAHEMGSLVSRPIYRQFTSSFDFKALYTLFVRILAEHQSSESFHSYEVDGTLLGTLRSLLILATCDTKPENQPIRDMVQHDEAMKETIHSLIDHIYSKCLFPPESASNPSAASSSIDMGASCQVWESRNLAYAILHQLCHHNEDNLHYLSQTISRHYVIQHPPIASLPTSSLSSTTTSAAAMVPVGKKLKNIHWGYNPNLLAKDSDAFVGLVNQGGTCYMNSFLQQLFHVPEFCDAILKVATNQNLADDAVITLYNDNDDDTSSSSDAFLFQLQVLFGYLRLSQKKFYDTLAFCKAFKDYDGQPISLIEQKDINEFAGMLFDKLESNPECKRALGNIIQGKVVYKTKSLESSYRSEREENFYMITAEVKGKSSLLESLELLVAEELFSGDNKIEDEEAGRKVDAIRRCTIRDLPSTLIIHLKRFEFDLETMDRKKVNDLITFPMDLDMFPYTEAGISMKEQRMQGHHHDQHDMEDNEDDDHENNENESKYDQPLGDSLYVDVDSDDNSVAPSISTTTRNRATSHTTSTKHRPENYYHYHLIGIVAHVGAIDRGHYYSFIKERSTQKWYEFNDRNVFPFSPEAIPNECFGGEEATSSSQGGQTVRMKQNSAYLLLYERVPLKQLTHSHKSADDCSNINHIHNIDGGKKLERMDSISGATSPPLDIITPAASNSMDSSSLIKTFHRQPWQLADMSKRVLQAVWSENIDFQTDRYIFSSYHFRFMWQLLSCPSFNSLLSAASNLPMIATLASEDKTAVEGMIHVKADYVENSMMASSTDDYEINSRSHSPSPSSTMNPTASPTLALLTLLGLKFTIEIVSSARALHCLPLFFDRLFEIINIDSTGECAYTIIQELSIAGNQPTIAQRYVDPRHHMNDRRRSHNNNVSSPGMKPVQKKSNQDLEYLAEHVHPWLVLVFVHCPIPTTVRAFAKLILTCIKKIRHKNKDTYLDNMISSTATKNPSSSASNDASSTVTGTEDIATDPSFTYMDILDTCKSPVTILMNKLLIISERISGEDAFGHDGFQLIGGLLYHVAMIGYEERIMLLKLQAIFRTVCALLALNSSPYKLPPESLSNYISMISILMRTTAVRRPDTREVLSFEVAMKSPTIEAYSLRQLQEGKQIEILEATDVQAFLNRVFLDDAVTINATAITSALIHICSCRGSKELIRICEFLNERIEECVLSLRGTTVATYRPYFKVLTDLLLSSGDQLSLTCDAFIPNMIQKAELAASRHGSTDAEFIYTVLKFFHRIGTSSNHGHMIAIKYREAWKKLRVKFSTAKRIGPPQHALTTSTPPTGQPNATGDASANNQSKHEDAAIYIKYKLEDLQL